ncbi:MAG TPA: R3H domain-containing nucleic acid-binding protein [Candidatus Sumerlaeota bacterium]|nr:R3H domain-containing nucleic acid-binding protein [Candidatus Sumerlaeota bacterium]
MKEIEIVTSSVEEALSIISKHLRLPSEAFEVLDTREDTREQAQPGKNLCVRMRINPAKLQQVVGDRLLGLLERMSIGADVVVSTDRDLINAEIRSDNGSVLIGKHGETIEAIQHLINRMVGRNEKDMPLIVVDTENYRERAHKRLKSIARTAADKVRKSGKAIKLDPMNPSDRKFIHKYLAEFRGISTQSVGREGQRRIVISPEGAPRVQDSVMEELLPDVPGGPRSRKRPRPLDQGPRTSQKSQSPPESPDNPDDMGELLDPSLLDR